MPPKLPKPDDIDREVKKELKANLWALSSIGLILAVTQTLYGLLHGDSVEKLSRELGELIASGLAMGTVVWLFSPIQEIRIRTKEIAGRVSVIEDAVVASKEDYAELAAKLTAIEDTLAQIQETNRTTSSTR